MNLREILGDGIQADLAIREIKKWFTVEHTDKPNFNSCYCIFLVPEKDENGEPKVITGKTIFGAEKTPEYICDVHYEYYDQNLGKTNAHVYAELLKANATIEQQNIAIEQQNKVVAAYVQLQRDYDDLLSLI
jgi:hypothetical protein